MKSLSLIFPLFVWSLATVGAEPYSVRTFLKPSQSIELSTTQTGSVGSIEVKLGDEVEVGDVIMTLNSNVLKAQLAQAEARAAMEGRVNAARAAQELAGNRVTLMEELSKKGSSNQAELSRGQTNLRMAEADLESALEEQALASLEVERIQVEIEERTLRSPIDGVVIEITRDVAENVAMRLENEKPYLARVVNLDELFAEAHIPYAIARDLKLGDAMTFSETADSVIEGTVSFVSPVTDPATGTVAIRVTFDNRGSVAASGVPGDLQIEAR